MFKLICKENGAALLYVLLIFSILIIISSVAFSLIENNQTKETMLYLEKEVTLLAVSGMQAYIQDPNTLTDDTYGNRNVVAIPDGTAIDYYQAAYANDGKLLSKNELANTTSYSVVISAISGDLNHNQQKDNDEKFFFKKELKYMLNGETPTPSEQTEMPLLDMLTIGSTAITGIAEKGAIIYAQLNGQSLPPVTADLPLTNTDSYDATLYGRFTIPVRPLKSGDTITVSAELYPQKTKSRTVTYNILQDDGTVSGGGYVEIIEEDGAITYQNMNHSIISDGKIIVLSATNDYQTNQDLTIKTTKSIVIESGVSITTSSENVAIEGDEGIQIDGNTKINLTNSGHGTFSLRTSTGDIVINGANLFNGAHASDKNGPAILKLEAPNGSINIDGSTLTSEKNIYISALLSISAKSATLLNEIKNTDITLGLGNVTNGTIFVDDLFVNQNAIANPTGIRICGTLKSGSNSVNGGISFNCTN